MGVVNYYGTDGEILGGSQAGDYMRDALGSVMATSSPTTGSAQNTYRYKPYGDLLNKTGTGIDPKYLWVGTSGLRTQLTSVYVQHSTVYSPEAAVPTSRSKTPFRGLVNDYLLDLPPNNQTEPNCISYGFSVHVRKDTSMCEFYGEAIGFGGDFSLAVRANMPNGFLVQHILVMCAQCRCDPLQSELCTPVPMPVPQYSDYYEAWPYTDGRLQPDVDESRNRVRLFENKFGQMNVRGRFMFCKTVPKNWIVGHPGTNAGGLLSGKNAPSGWDQDAPITRHSQAVWNWCRLWNCPVIPRDRPDYSCDTDVGLGISPGCAK